MKFTTIYTGNNKIEIFNSILGKETVKVNDEVVSSKHSLLGAEHNFSILENGIESPCKISLGFGVNGTVFSFYKDHQPVVESPKSGWMTAIIAVLLIIIIVAVLTAIMK